MVRVSPVSSNSSDQQQQQLSQQLTPVGGQNKLKLTHLLQKLQLKLLRIMCFSNSYLPEYDENNGVDENNGRGRREEEIVIPLEELEAWSQGFEKLMASMEGRRQLTEFLKGEYSDENILFWQACEELKRETNAEKVEEKARIIYEDFISILSPKEVSLDSRVREKVNANMAQPTANTFDEAQYQIWTLMMRDSYPRFINSHNYRDVVDARKAERDLQEIQVETL